MSELHYFTLDLMIFKSFLYPNFLTRGPYKLLQNRHFPQCDFWGYPTFYQINKCFANTLFFIIDKMSLWPCKMVARAGWNCFAVRIWPAGRS